MKPLLLLLTVSLSSTTFAQKIEAYYDYRWKETKPETARFLAVTEKTDSGWHRRDYYMQEKMLQMDGTYEDSLCKRPNGYFWYYYPNGRLDRAGHYFHSKKTGLWLSYHYNGMMSDSSSYNYGHKVGHSY